MREVLRLLKPPEWAWWSGGDRFAYVVSLGFALLLMTLGAGVLKGWIERLIAGLIQ